jgi:hypothetical protein
MNRRMGVNVSEYNQRVVLVQKFGFRFTFHDLAESTVFLHFDKLHLACAQDTYHVPTGFR